MGGSLSSLSTGSRPGHRQAHNEHQHELNWPAAAPAAPLQQSKAAGRALGRQGAHLGPEAGSLEVAAGAGPPRGCSAAPPLQPPPSRPPPRALPAWCHIGLVLSDSPPAHRTHPAQADGTVSWTLRSRALEGTAGDAGGGDGPSNAAAASAGAPGARACSPTFAIPAAAQPRACAGLLAAHQWRLACEVSGGESPQLSVFLRVSVPV